MISPNTRNGIVVLALLTIAGLWLGRAQRTEEDAGFGDIDPQLDYALFDFELRVLDEQGQPRLKMRSPRLDSDARSGVGTVSSPVIEMQQPEAEWRIEARSATISADREHVWLSGAVEVERRARETALVSRLTTEQLGVDVTPRRARTNAPVTLVEGDDRISAIGMRLDMARNRFELLRQVEATYAIE